MVTRGNGNETTLEIVKTSRAATDESAREMLGLVTVDYEPERISIDELYPGRPDRR